MNRIKRLLSNPKIKYGGYAGIITFAVIAAVLVLNVFVGQLGWQVDMTEGSVFTLGEQTRSVLDELEKPVTIYILASRNNVDELIMEALERYEQASPMVTIEVIDAETNPGFINQYDPEGTGLTNGTVIVASEDNYRVIRAIDLYAIDQQDPSSPRMMGINVERRVTNALIFVGTGRTPIIYATTGHGERTVAVNPGLPGDIEAENYEIRDLNLLQAAQVPDDAAILLMFGPRVDLNESESEKIQAYLDGGGNAFILLDVLPEPTPVLDALLEKYGLSADNAVIVELDANHHTSDNPLNLLPVYQDQDIVNPIVESQTPMLLYLGRPVNILDAHPREARYESIISTSDQAYARFDLSEGSPEPVASDRLGPFDLAVSAVATDLVQNEEVWRIVLVGNALFMGPINRYGYPEGNRDFFLNSLAWLQNQDESLTIRPKFTFQRVMQLNATQVLVFGGLFLIVIPLAILITGLVVWLKRRHL